MRRLLIYLLTIGSLYPQLLLASMKIPNCLNAPVSETALQLTLEHVKEASKRHEMVLSAVNERFIEYPTTDQKQQVLREMLYGIVSGALSSNQKQSASQLQTALYQRLEIYCQLMENTTQQTAKKTTRDREVAVATGSANSVRLRASNETIDERLDELFAGAVGKNLKEMASHEESETEADPIPDYEAQVKEAIRKLQKLEYAHRQIMSCKTGSSAGAITCAVYLNEAFESNRDDMPQDCENLAGAHTNRSDRLNCGSAIHHLMRTRYDEIADAEAQAIALGKAGAEQVQAIKRLRTGIQPVYDRSLSQEAIRGPSYGIYAGPSMLLQKDGGWKSGAEILGKFDTEYFSRGTFCFFISCRGSTEISFVSPEQELSTEQNAGDVPVDAFNSKGRFSIRGMYRGQFNDWAGLEAGVGVTGPIRDSSPTTSIEPRVNIGAHFQTLYTDGMLGELSLGYARDKYWRYLTGTDDATTTDDERVVEKAYDRWYMDGTVLFPNLELGGWRLAGRVSADWPTSGTQEGDLRASILFYYPFNNWLEDFNPKNQTKGN